MLGTDETAPTDPFFARREHLDVADQMQLKALDKGGLSFAQYRRDRPGLGLTAPNPCTETYMLVVKLNEFSPHHMWCDGRYMQRPRLAVGSLGIYDLRRTWITDLQEPFHTINFFLPQRSLDELAEELRAPRIDELLHPSEVDRKDDVMMHLALSLQPALERPGEVSQLFADQVAAAMCSHVAATYGGLQPGTLLGKGGLAPWQERRVKDMLMTDLRGDVSLSDLASACDLSVGYFTRAFKQTTGRPPHRWLMEQRIKRAKALLLDPSKTLAEVAEHCGFANQSHFTRVFSRAVGSTPGAWRRMLGRR